MAIKLIKKGRLKFKILCPQCKALISYEIQDIVGIAIECPCCGEFCYHYNRIKEESEDTE